MNKILLVVLIVLGLALTVYNITLVNFESPLDGNSIIALIGVVASLCAVALLLIYATSKKIEKKMKE
ncbi:hypothetical protein [Arenibacter certesii]|uniref:Uncharacterized protein n=1 Tax=Arenibacter certesii TaxID=228955 RepID=A0A918IYA0_9FLAO|nr:hypothetical protein [Arenibacter certesii]GGW37967.1 hypothetical protein GCM10007383_23470 [Arenibacter certesii]